MKSHLHDSWVLRNTWQPMLNYGNFFKLLIKKRCMMTCPPIYCTLMPVFLLSFYFHKTCLQKQFKDVLVLRFKQKKKSELYSEYHSSFSLPLVAISLVGTLVRSADVEPYLSVTFKVVPQRENHLIPLELQSFSFCQNRTVCAPYAPIPWILPFMGF